MESCSSQAPFRETSTALRDHQLTLRPPLAPPMPGTVCIYIAKHDKCAFRKWSFSVWIDVMVEHAEFD